MNLMDPQHRYGFRTPRPRATLIVEGILDRARVGDWPFVLEIPWVVGLICAIAVPAAWSFSPVAVVGGVFCLGIAAYWFYRRVHRRRQQLIWKIAGHCVHCGYDLRASPTRCPECGMSRR
jgi:hypothetical protein